MCACVFPFVFDCSWNVFTAPRASKGRSSEINQSAHVCVVGPVHEVLLFRIQSTVTSWHFYSPLSALVVFHYHPISHPCSSLLQSFLSISPCFQLSSSFHPNHLSVIFPFPLLSYIIPHPPGCLSSSFTFTSSADLRFYSTSFRTVSWFNILLKYYSSLSSSRQLLQRRTTNLSSPWGPRLRWEKEARNRRLTGRWYGTRSYPSPPQKRRWGRRPRPCPQT